MAGIEDSRMTGIEDYKEKESRLTDQSLEEFGRGVYTPLGERGPELRIAGTVEIGYDKKDGSKEKPLILFTPYESAAVPQQESEQEGIRERIVLGEATLTLDQYQDLAKQHRIVEIG